MTLGGCADFCVGDGLDAFTAPGWRDEPAPAVVWCQDAMIASEIDPRPERLGQSAIQQIIFLIACSR